MRDETLKPVILPRSNLLRWELGVALLIKVLFLVGLWFWFFQPPALPRPEIGDFLGLPISTPPDTPTATPAFTAPPQPVNSAKHSQHFFSTPQGVSS